MTSYATAGEELIGRKLRKERRVGVDHFVPGQHHADLVFEGEQYGTGKAERVMRLSFVDQMGHACLLLCSSLDGGPWFATWATRAGQVTREPDRRVESDFPLSDAMLAAISRAERRSAATSTASQSEISGGRGSSTDGEQ